MKTPNWLKCLGSIAIAELAGGIGSLFTGPNIDSWYKTLVRPELAPPNWVFGPVWTTLFTLMGIAAYLVWRKGTKQERVKVALRWYGIQLVLNILWSYFFFGLQCPLAGLIEILILWLAILATIITFSKVSRPAAWLLVPYLLWVSFATYLTYSIWQLN